MVSLIAFWHIDTQRRADFLLSKVLIKILPLFVLKGSSTLMPSSFEDNLNY